MNRPFCGPGLGFVGVVVVGPGGVGSVDVSTAVVVAGTGAGWVTVTWEVAVKIGPFALAADALSAIAVAAPAIATTNVRSEIHIQSPGYQPKRRIQRRRSDASRPVTAGSRRPQSRQ